jgi:hypothetical protein
MKKDSIVQFVGFITGLGFDSFIDKWERYAKRLINNKSRMISQQQAGIKSRFTYVSHHEWSAQDFQFSFMNERKSEHFPEHNVKVVQMGGYTPLQIESNHKHEYDGVKVMAFIGHAENDIEFYKQAADYDFLNIYQAYYESCSYGYVMEFFIPEKGVAGLIEQLKKRTGVETGVYKECMVTSVA